MTDPVPRPSLEEIRQAADRLRGTVVRTPLVKLDVADGSGEIYLKLENLQPIGSFKVRGAGNAMALADPATLSRGVYTASAGNMAQGVAWHARQLGVACTVVVPDDAPATKLAAIERLGAQVLKVPFDRWWRVLVEHRYPGLEGHFIHPVSDPAVVAGNGTAGLEIVEDLEDVATIVVPFGGGGLACGIAAAARALRPEIRVIAAEVSTAAPLAASLAAGAPTPIDRQASFVDGIGGKTVLHEMWPLVRELLAGSIVSTPEAIAAAVGLLVERNRVVAEGAGAAGVAAALGNDLGPGKVVCLVSGGNIDAATLAAILAGELPGGS
ncbi:MAG: pyridoxal-phosphate dependent enzyme [Acidobacteria bacterium]|nr:pyridoxal-phosphate dependent enzyme [Acidobacteriota bacterium]MCZ6727405.1 pyridoxal-phosphate dependent enzyme [Acidobacteriota bacterium]